jgi:hypothetical protein
MRLAAANEMPASTKKRPGKPGAAPEHRSYDKKPFAKTGAKKFSKKHPRA